MIDYMAAMIVLVPPALIFAIPWTVKLPMLAFGITLAWGFKQVAG